MDSNEYKKRFKELIYEYPNWNIEPPNYDEISLDELKNVYNEITGVIKTYNDKINKFKKNTKPSEIIKFKESFIQCDGTQEGMFNCVINDDNIGNKFKILLLFSILSDISYQFILFKLKDFTSDNLLITGDLEINVDMGMFSEPKFEKKDIEHAVFMLKTYKTKIINVECLCIELNKSGIDKDILFVIIKKLLCDHNCFLDETRDISIDYIISYFKHRYYPINECIIM